MISRQLVAIAALLAGLTLAARPAPADQTDPRLPALFEALMASPDPIAAANIEGQIWQLWLDGGSEAINQQLRIGMRAMSDGRLHAAIAAFSDVTSRAPGFAEGWNKRATAYYLAGQLDSSMADIERTLALEARHFGAISGMGLIFLQLGDERGALRAFQEVLKINPNSPVARAQVKVLSERVGGAGA